MPGAGLRIGVIAPPWLPVPPPAYGGTELMLDALCVGLKRAGHDVTLFTIAESTCAVPTAALFDSTDPDRMGTTVLEMRHVAAAYDLFKTVDVIHDHSLIGLFYSECFPDVPVVTTNHAPFNDDMTDLYRRVADRVPIIAISHDQASRAPGDLPIEAVIHHGLHPGRYPFRDTAGEHVLFLGRMSADKGVDIAIRAARQAGEKLLIAAKMREPGERRFFRDEVEPLLGPGVEYIGEADFATKIELLSNARALLNPITWPEPFGLVMIEAMACGTPVVGFGCGAAPEIVTSGYTGYLVDDEDGLAHALGNIDAIDRTTCRNEFETYFSARRMVEDHVEVYRAAMRRAAGRRHPTQSLAGSLHAHGRLISTSTPAGTPAIVTSPPSTATSTRLSPTGMSDRRK